MTLLLCLAGLGAVACCAAAFWMLRALAAAERLEGRLRQAQGLSRKEGARPAGPRSTLRWVSRLGAAITDSGVLPKATLKQLQAALDAAGFRSPHALGLLVGGKAVLALGLPLLAVLLVPELGLSRMMGWAAVAGAAAAGLLAPDHILGKLRARHLRKVEAGLADALDMMVICAEAGVGLEMALVRVGTEMRHVHPALAEELARTSGELQVMSDSRTALSNMGSRTGLDCLRRLGTTLIQTMQFGTPLSAALRMLAVELRQETLTRFEERAARLPVLLTLPMILFILPCVFLVVGGPAVIQISHMFQH